MKLALDRNLDIAVQRLNPQINDIAIASLQSIYHPTLTSQVFSQSTGQPVDERRIAGSSVAGTSIDTNLTTYNGGIAQSFPMGRRQPVGRAEQQPADVDGPDVAVQPGLQHELVGHLHAAAAARLQDRFDPPADSGHEDQSGHLRHPAQVVDHQHAVERPQRLLGLRLRGPVRGRRATVARPGDQARAGQPDARAGRHDGADRRGLGAIGAGHAQPGPGHRGVRQADDRARAQAAHRRRRRRSELGRGPDADGSTQFSAGRDRSRGAPSGGRSASAPTWTSPRRTSRPTTSRCATSTTRRCRRSTCSSTYGLMASAARQLITEGTGVNRTVIGSLPGRLWRRAGARCSDRTIPTLDRADELLAIRSA